MQLSICPGIRRHEGPCLGRGESDEKLVPPERGSATARPPRLALPAYDLSIRSRASATIAEVGGPRLDPDRGLPGQQRREAGPTPLVCQPSETTTYSLSVDVPRRWSRSSSACPSMVPGRRSLHALTIKATLASLQRQVAPGGDLGFNAEGNLKQLRQRRASKGSCAPQ